MNDYLINIYNNLEKTYPLETEYLNSVKSFFKSINDIIDDNIIDNKIIEDLIIPNKVITFKIKWKNSKGKLEINNGYRVQFNNTLGVYKGGIRFDKSVNLSILKFLSLEQTLKNSLTSLPLGGAKGGSDFNPIGRTKEDIKLFTKEYAKLLTPYLGHKVDVPAGDLGVGHFEIDIMDSTYMELTNESISTFTGKPVDKNGSKLRFEATGYGLAYITAKALSTYFKTDFKDKTVIVSGSGVVGLNAAYKVVELGGKVLAISSIDGVIFDENGVDLDLIGKLNSQKASIEKYIFKYPKANFINNPKEIWKIKADIYMPCATQNEIDLESAKHLVDNNILLLAEGSNKPTTSDALEYLLNNKVLVIPSKAANAGGVSVSYFEMQQNALNEYLSSEEVDLMLKGVMENIFKDIYRESLNLNDKLNLTKAADIVGAKRVFDELIRHS